MTAELTKYQWSNHDKFVIIWCHHLLPLQNISLNSGGGREKPK